MSKRKHEPESDDKLDRDTPVKIDLPFEEAVKRLVRDRDDQATSDDAEESDDSR